MQLEAARTRYQLLHEERPYHDGSRANWAKEPSLEFPFHFTDGASISLAEEDLGLGGDFLEQGSVAAGEDALHQQPQPDEG